MSSGSSWVECRRAECLHRSRFAVFQTVVGLQWRSRKGSAWAYCDIIEGGKTRRGTARRQGHKVYVIIFMPTLITEVERVGVH